MGCVGVAWRLRRECVCCADVAQAAQRLSVLHRLLWMLQAHATIDQIGL